MTRMVLGLLLLVAAGLKAHQLATEPVPETSLLTSRWFLIIWVETEIVLGLWFLTGLARRAAWGAALACFSVFSLVTLYKALSGDVSCGCFGRVEVSPWYTFVLDVAAVGALVLFRPDTRTPVRATTSRARFGVAAAAGFVVVIGAGLAAILYSPSTLSDDGQIVGEKRVVLLKPETWVGRAWPLLGHIDIGKQLAKGKWTVVLYHHDCPHCEERVPQFEREARKRAGRLAGSKVAMVELAPYAPKGRSLLPPDTTCTTGRVNDVRDWFVGTPTVLTLVEGSVVDAREGDDSEAARQVRLTGLTPAPGESPVPFEKDGYDFGFVRPKTSHKVLLEVANPSTKPLGIVTVRSECACMSAVTSEDPTPPGGSVPVRVVLVAPKRSQHYNKRILLQTDDPKHPVVPIRIKAAVGLPLCIDPAVLDLGEVASGRHHERPVTVVNRCSKPVRLIYSTSSGSGCFARVPREPVPALGSLAVPIVVTARDKGQGRTTVRIQTDLDFQPAVSVPVRFTVGSAETAGGPLRVGLGPETRKDKMR